MPALVLRSVSPPRARAALVAPLVLALGACSASLVCGEGTRQVGDRCVPILACGPGTVAMGEACVPLDMLVCGAGTLRMGDACVRDDLGCPAGTLQRGDACVDADLIVVRVPFEAGSVVEIGQGMHGGFSHAGAQVHALDFPAATGTTIVAARDGIVVDVREDSSTGCGDPSCADQGNYVRIDHGDGTYASYYHLETDGALVGVGDRVCAGEPIARAGSTGFSTGPHLHFQVEDAFGYSLPLYVEDLGDVTEGWAFAGVPITSTNAPPATCDHAIEPAPCAPDLFAHDGIVELTGMPCALAERGRTYRVTGRALGAARTGQLVLRGDLDADWSYDCGTTSADGRFALDVVFPPSRVGVRAYAGVTGASAVDCASADGWDTAPRIVVR